MINCSEFRNLAGEFLEGAERPDLSAHMDSCAACRNLVDDLRAIAATAASLVDLTDLEPREGLWAGLRERAEAEGLFASDISATSPASASAQGMTCNEFEEFAGDVLEGGRNPKAFEHLYSCANCREFLHELDAIAGAAHNLPVYEPQPQLWHRLRAAARAEDLWQENSWWERWLIPQPILASGLAAAVLVFGVVMVSLDTLDPYGNIAEPSVLDLTRSGMTTEVDYPTRYGTDLLQVERAVLDENTNIDERMIELVEQPLNTVDRAIQRTQLALSENPGDEMVRKELNRLFRQKATVLAAMTDLTWQEYGE